MQLIVKLKDAATVGRGVQARRAATPDELQRIAQSAGESIRPLHPAATDAALARYYVIDVREPKNAQILIERLLQSPLVDAAYAKPPDAPP